MPRVDEFGTFRIQNEKKLHHSLPGRFSILFFQIEMILEFLTAIILSLTFYTVHGIGICIAEVQNLRFYCLRRFHRSGKF